MRASFPSRTLGLAAALVCASYFILPAQAQTFDVRAKTRDRIRAWIYSPNVGYTTSLVFQGSFGAPSINDKGSIAYACILGGTGISAFRNNTVVFRAKGKKPSKVAWQSGFQSIVPDGFGYAPINTFLLSGSVYLYRISRDVAINNTNRIAFSAQSLFTYYTVNDKGQRTYTESDTATYGLLSPVGAGPRSFQPIPLSTFINYFDGILEKTISLNPQNAIAYNASFFITSTKAVEGFAFSSPNNGGVISTVESNVIGLPYFATFQSFTDAIISNRNAAFVTAQISDGNNGFDGIWQGNNPDLIPVAVKTNDAPDGGKFTTFGEKAGPSRNGKFCAFTASTTKGTNGVFRSTVVNDWTSQKDTEKILIAQAGDTAPTNSKAGTLGVFSSFSLAASNDVGQVALIGTVNGKEGIWVSDAKGANLKLVAIAGQTLTVDSTEKTINSIAFNPVSGINRTGQIAFTASFSDRTSAVIIASF
jgi:hypothetical protein